MQSSVDDGVVVLKLIAQEQQVTNSILLHLTQQLDTMIYSLSAISHNTCNIANESHIQTELQRSIANSEAALLDISKTINPAVVVDLERREAILKAQEACCPTQLPPPICNYKPCPAPPPLSIKPRRKNQE